MKKFSFAMTIAMLSFLFQSCEKDFNETTTSNIKTGKGFKMLSYTTSPNIFCSEITQHQATVDNIAVLPLTNLNFKPY
jgi:hypothetical protein